MLFTNILLSNAFCVVSMSGSLFKRTINGRVSGNSSVKAFAPASGPGTPVKITQNVRPKHIT